MKEVSSKSEFLSKENIPKIIIAAVTAGFGLYYFGYEIGKAFYYLEN